MIHIEHLTKRYGTFTAVDDISFTAHPDRGNGAHPRPSIRRPPEPHAPRREVKR